MHWSLIPTLINHTILHQQSALLSCSTAAPTIISKATVEHLQCATTQEEPEEEPRDQGL
jgi:hypothetical protein